MTALTDNILTIIVREQLFVDNCSCIIHRVTLDGTDYNSRAQLRAKFHYAILVADRSEAGRRPATSWNLAYHLAGYQRTSTS